MAHFGFPPELPPDFGHHVMAGPPHRLIYRQYSIDIIHKLIIEYPITKDSRHKTKSYRGKYAEQKKRCHRQSS